MRHPFRHLRRLAREERGASAVEFALIMPVIAMLLFGSAGMFDHIQAKQRAIKATDTLGDLIARTQEMNDTERDAVFSAVELMLGKYADRVTVNISISGVVYDEDEAVMRVVWSEKYNQGAQLVVGQELPAEGLPIIPDSEMLILTATDFSYRSPVYFLTGEDWTFTQSAVRKPRLIPVIQYNEPRYQ